MILNTLRTLEKFNYFMQQGFFLVSFQVNYESALSWGDIGKMTQSDFICFQRFLRKKD